MPVLVEDATEAVPSVDVEPGGGVRPGDGRGQWAQRPGVGYSLVRPMGIVELLELTQSMQQVPLAPDQGPVKQLAAAGLYPPLHDRVRSRHLDAAEHDLDPASLRTASSRPGNLASRSVRRRPGRLGRGPAAWRRHQVTVPAQHRPGPDRQPEPAERIPREPVQQGGQECPVHRTEPQPDLVSCLVSGHA